MEAPGNDGVISFLDIKCSPNLDHTIHTSVYRKLSHTFCYPDWNSNHPISAKKAAVTHALIYRTKNVCSTAEVLNNYPHCMIKESKKKPATPIGCYTGSVVDKCLVFLFPKFLASVRNSEGSFDIPVYR